MSNMYSWIRESGEIWEFAHSRGVQSSSILGPQVSLRKEAIYAVTVAEVAKIRVSLKIWVSTSS